MTASSSYSWTWRLGSTFHLSLSVATTTLSVKSVNMMSSCAMLLSTMPQSTLITWIGSDGGKHHG
jgi:hypothetical protein